MCPEAAPRVSLVLAQNPGPFTLEGTNTWVVGRSPSLVIDPGPDDDHHLRAVVDVAGSIEAVLLTHHHPDHALGAAGLAELAGGARVFAASPREGESALADGTTVEGGEVGLIAVFAPGHSPDHVVFFEPEARALFTGDAVLGTGTSVIDPPEGDLRAYLASLERMRSLDPAILYPGHGPVVEAAREKLLEYIEHRRARERQVLDALANGPRAPEEIVPAIYGDHPKELHPAAARSVLAHLLKLDAEGMVRRVPASLERFELARRHLVGPHANDGGAEDTART